MNVREIMATPELTVRRETSVTEAARLLLDRHLSGVPVVDEDNRLLGMVTQRDLVAKHAHVHLPVFVGILGYVAPFQLPGSGEEVERVLAVTVEDLMETDVETVDTGATVDDVATIMVDKGVDPLAVVEDGRLAGVVSMADVIRLVLIEEEGTGAG